MARKLNKVPQPPIGRLSRASEHRSLVIAAVVIAAGGAMILWGLRPRKVGDGAAAAYSDYQLVGLIRTGAVEQPEAVGSGSPGQAGATSRPADPQGNTPTSPPGNTPKPPCPT